MTGGTRLSFDRYRDSYNRDVERAISFLRQEHSFFTEAKARILLDLAARQLGPVRELSALDVGCGIGLTDSYLAGEFGRLEAVDVSEAVLDRAVAANPGVTYQLYDGQRLPYADGSLDLAFAIGVMHHVPAVNWATFAGEMTRVIRSGGLVVIFEHNPLNPLTRLAVSRCAFDEDVALLTRQRTNRLLTAAGLVNDESRFILFFPWRSRWLSRLEKHLGTVPLGAQYYAAGRKMPF
jgi:SAM-dependent methyltransferase